jgi:hypothetical protein
MTLNLRLNLGRIKTEILVNPGCWIKRSLSELVAGVGLRVVVGSGIMSMGPLNGRD